MVVVLYFSDFVLQRADHRYVFTLIKKVCRDLLAKLKTEKLVLEWRTKRTTRAAVRVEIEKMLDSGLPEKYSTELFKSKCGALLEHVLEKYPDQGASVYGEAG